jgi:cobalt-zinc-cadmium efflux system protein
MGHSHGHTHGHSHGHSHGHHAGLNEKNLILATVMNVVITVAEIVGGLLSNSLALLSDAVHNLGDTFAIALAFVANRIGKRDATLKKTFGYKRIEILAALLNAVVLIAITLFLFIEAYKRFQDPEPIKGKLMFIVATVGLLANVIAVLLLRKDADSNLNIRAAYLHLLGDSVSSVAVIAGSVLIYFFEIFWVDPLITILIGIYILKETYAILKESVNILMQSTPPGINVNDIVDDLEQMGEVDNIHHVHTWQLDDKQIHFECHADLSDDILISQANSIRSKIETELKNKFGISHVTIQFEYRCCHEKAVIHT